MMLLFSTTSRPNNNDIQAASGASFAHSNTTSDYSSNNKNNPRFKQRLKQDLLKTSAPRMLAFCAAYVVFQIFTTFFTSNFALMSSDLSASSLWLSEGLWITLKIVAVCLGAVFAITFGFVAMGSIRIPKTQSALVQACLVMLTATQVLLLMFELTGAYFLHHYVVYVLMLGVLPLLPRATSSAYLVAFTLLSAAAYLLVVAPQMVGTTSAAEALAGQERWEGSLTGLSYAPSLVAGAVSTGHALVVPAVFLASLTTSWLSYGLAKKQSSAQSMLEQREAELEALVDKRTAEYKERVRVAEAANLAKTRFLTRTSHEMRTSLNTITGMVFVAKDTDDIPTKRESLEAVDIASKKLKDIVGTIIDTALIELEFTGDDTNQESTLLDADAAAPLHKHEVVAPPDLSGHTILIVEDLETNRLVLREFLKNTRATIEEAPNGKIAVEMFNTSAEHYYSFVFMDLLMPEMNGHDATRAIRMLERADATDVPIVAVSANAFKEDIEASLAAGMDAHLAKPIEQATLFRTLIERLT